MNASLAALAYLVSGVLFILSLRGLSSPETSRRGNTFGMIGMGLAIGVTLLTLGATRALDPLTLALIAGGAGVVVMLAGARVLDALSAGDEIAHGLGIHPDRARVGFLLVVSLCTAAAVAGAGSIGFVGLVTPHLARRLVGARHRVLIPASALLGGLFLLWADAFARVVMQPRELPIGVLTAAIGAPFLLILVRRLYARQR